MIFSPIEINSLVDNIQARHILAERLVYEGDVWVMEIFQVKVGYSTKQASKWRRTTEVEAR